MKIIVASAAAASLCITLQTSSASTLILPPPHSIDPLEVALDSTPPAAPQIIKIVVSSAGTPQAVGIEEPRQGVYEGGTGYCSAIVYFVPPLDNRTEIEGLGYEIEHLSGYARLRSDSGPRRSLRVYKENELPIGRLPVYWKDSVGSFEFTLAIRAVDLAGNRSELSVPFVIESRPGKNYTITPPNQEEKH